MECPGKPETGLRNGVHTIASEIDVRPHPRSKTGSAPFGADVGDNKRRICPSARRAMFEYKSQDIVRSADGQGNRPSAYANGINMASPLCTKLLNLPKEGLNRSVYEF